MTVYGVPDAAPASDAFTACPKCGGSRGFEYISRVEMEGEWGIPAESGVWTSPLNVRCLDCGERCNRRRSEGYSLADVRSQEGLR